ncbi:protein kinase C delta type-like [Engystomops pustulosus]|uniref:protein kinase C delta type-like n=1 Tax=Engystomops pustulosus TaxID=76066 RepID=UPI003AFA6E98
MANPIIEEPGKMEKSRKRKGNRFLFGLRKPWNWFVGLKQRGTDSINETGSSEIPGAGHMVDTMVNNRANVSSPVDTKKDDNGEQSTKMSSGKAVPSATATARTVPLSLLCFTFHHTLGQGSYSQVFLATDVIRKERVAIKVVNKMVYTVGCCSFAEQQILQLSHGSPYLIHGLAAFHTSKCAYYVMEVAARGDLQGFITRTGPLDIKTVKFIAAEVVCGIESLHNHGILHCDLKLNNLLLTAEGHVKITDFGLAMTGAVDGRTSSLKGTPGYSAPEMVRGEAFGKGVDYFALGVILYKVITSKRPFPGRTDKDRQQSVLYHTPLYPATLAPDTVSFIQGLLCKNQFQRLGVYREVRTCPFFTNINWADVDAQRLAPPAVLVTGSVDLNVEDTLNYAEPPYLYYQKVKDEIFNQFSFVCTEWSRQYHPVTKTKSC